MFGGSWTEQKLDTVSSYLQAYVTALKKTPFDTMYIDAFAGSGYVDPPSEPDESDDQLYFPELAAPEPRQFLEGSVRRALRTQPPFGKYLFIERSAKRAAELESLKTEFAALADRIDVRTGDANEVVQQVCRNGQWKGRRGVLFLDPYGMQVDWATLEAAAATRALDTWILLPHAIGVGRTLPKSGKVPKSWRRTLTRFLGTDAWENDLYTVTETTNLLGAVERIERASVDRIGEYILTRLRTIFAAVERPAILRNSKGTPLYMLVFAVNSDSAKGQEIATRIASHLLKEHY